MPDYYGSITTGSNSNVWQTWCVDYSTNSTTATTISRAVWGNWCVAGTTASNSGGYRAFSQLPALTEEQIAEQQRQTEEANRKWEEGRPAREAAAEEARKQREAAKKKAERKAGILLRRHLDATQRKELKKEKAFHVITAQGTRYRIAVGRSGNVAELNAKGEAVRRFCIHPQMNVPNADTMLAQKLLLETDEAAFMRIANMTVLRAG